MQFKKSKKNIKIIRKIKKLKKEKLPVENLVLYYEDVEEYGLNHTYKKNKYTVYLELIPALICRLDCPIFAHL